MPPVDFGKVDVLIAFGMGVTDALFTRMPALQWVQSLATGVDHFLRSKTLPAGRDPDQRPRHPRAGDARDRAASDAVGQP